MQKNSYIAKTSFKKKDDPFQESERLIEDAKHSFFEMVREEQRNTVRDVFNPIKPKP